MTGRLSLTDVTSAGTAAGIGVVLVIASLAIFAGCWGISLIYYYIS
ncbi:MAG: hypothetical protein NTV84_11480 [Methanoregula sp.]|nr:hypothetical protein [Methanoregula sp.]